MTDKHTPGPWDWHDEDDKVFVTADPHRRFVCEALFPSDARLIASAPELLGDGEFLCARLRDLEGFDGDELLRQLMGHVLPALARMEMSIAKARGETA